LIVATGRLTDLSASTRLGTALGQIAAIARTVASAQTEAHARNAVIDQTAARGRSALRDQIAEQGQIAANDLGAKDQNVQTAQIVVPGLNAVLGLSEPGDLIVDQDQTTRGEALEVLVSSFDSVLLDLDGVVYQGELAVTNAVESVNKLQGLDIKVGYITNNSSRRAETIAEQLTS
jgi:phosphoglycolate phosphatase-like HAD superfamily hydrolase